MSSALSACLGLLTERIRAEPKVRSRPNILWLVSEDNGPFIGAYGDRIARTPNIDALARGGLLFRHVYSAAPVCAPSRFSILTGIYPQSCAPANHMRARAQLPAGFSTYPQLLREAGYYCTNNSKTDYNCDVAPAAIWDESSSTAHWRNRPSGSRFLSVFNYATTHESRMFAPVRGAVPREAVRVPAYLPDTALVRDDYVGYYDLMQKMDLEIGSRLAELSADGLAEDTIVFYYSDNGGVLPRSKRYCYEEGLRVALIVYIPPKWSHLLPSPAGTEITSPVSLLDLAPTLLSIIGEPKNQHMHGNAFLGPNRAPQRYAFGMRNRMDERYDFVRTVTDGRYRYIRNYMPHRPCGQHGAFQWQMKSYQEWEREYLAGRLNSAQVAFFRPRPHEELFDLSADPDQVHNLATDPLHAGTLRSLSEVLSAHMLQINDNGFIPEGVAVEGNPASLDRTAYPLEVIMELAADAAKRDRRKVGALRGKLAHKNEIVRYWAAMGLLMLGGDAAPAMKELLQTMREDSSLHVQVVAAESVTHLGALDEGVAKLADILDRQLTFPIRLQALNALTFIGQPARAALPAIERAARSQQEYLRSAGRYLLATLNGTYSPSYPVFDVEFFRSSAPKDVQ